MSTRAVIAYENQGSYTATYLHFDGYPDHAGLILKTHFAEAQAALELASSSEIRSLDEAQVDRYDDGWPAVHTRDLDDYAYRCGAAYVYVYQNGAWTTR